MNLIIYAGLLIAALVLSLYSLWKRDPGPGIVAILLVVAALLSRLLLPY